MARETAAAAAATNTGFLTATFQPPWDKQALFGGKGSKVFTCSMCGENGVVEVDLLGQNNVATQPVLRGYWLAFFFSERQQRQTEGQQGETRGCIVRTYSNFEDDISYLYPDEEELFEEEDQGSHCGDAYYDRIALYCWPKFHAALMAIDDSSRCLWEMIGSVYGELALCTGLVAAGMGCPMSSSTLDAFFMRIHAEYFTNCSLPSTSAPDHQPHTGTVAILIFLSVCLVPISVVLILRKV
nr:uncharacterized protein LOC110080280 [Pogona vitticeps]